MATLNADARTKADEVDEIMDTEISSNDLKAFINTANNLIDNNLTGLGLSSDQLTDIEKWLSAHFASMRDRAAESVKEGDVSVKFEGDTGLGLDHTRFGQVAKGLDHTGTLAEIDSRAKGEEEGAKVASIDTIGKKPADRYTDNVN